MTLERDSELVFESMRRILGPDRPFVVLFQGTDEEDRIVTTMHPADTLETLKTAVREMEAGRTRDIHGMRRKPQ